MTKQFKLSKLKVDIDFVDPVTFKKVCSFNQCIEKFEPHSEVIEHCSRLGTHRKENGTFRSAWSALEK
jgi:hypothetical protein